MIRKVKYIGDVLGIGLSWGKVYDVISHIPDSEDINYDRIFIINDRGENGDYYYRNVFFIDVTTECRNKLIEDILR